MEKKFVLRRESSIVQENFDDEEISRVQTAFSELIDETCSNDSTSRRSIFIEINENPKSIVNFLMTIAPDAESLQKEIQVDSTGKLFEYGNDHESKYTFKVLDRRTNRLCSEQMPSYHRYAMKIFFRGVVQREILQTRAIRNFFARETIRLGKSFDEPKSRKHIAAFVKMYQIDLNELQQPNIEKYFNFNEFFYRKLKVDARPIDNRDDPNGIVSPADCRLILFDNVNEATRIWIKGLHFSLENLFDDRNLPKNFNDASIAVFRLAPDDYHRFHSPIQGRIGAMIKKISGTFYTVNPIGFEETFDVLTENQRTLITIDSEQFEQIVFVAVGALLVGSVNFTVKPMEKVEKGQELGFFAYGGSTIVVVFKEGMVKWDDDIRHNSVNSMETLVKMGEHIGQRMTEDQRQQYFNAKNKQYEFNSTVSHLIHHFPNRRQVKR